MTDTDKLMQRILRETLSLWELRRLRALPELLARKAASQMQFGKFMALHIGRKEKP